MIRPTLHVVPPPPAKDETVGQRVQRLQTEARALAHDHSRSLAQALDDIEQLAAAIAGGGDAYLPGVRELARRVADDAASKGQTLDAILGRAR